MKKMFLFALCLALIATYAQMGCAGRPYKSNIDDGEPFGFDWSVSFEEIDTNGDGFINQNELNRWGGYYPDGGTRVFYNVDKDNSGMIDKAEFEAARKKPPATGAETK